MTADGASIYGTQAYLEALQRLRVNRQGGRRWPHKPLLLLVAIARLLKGERELPFAEAEFALLPLLRAYAPPVRAAHQPELPYWYLQSDGLWEVPGAEGFPRQAGGFPRMAALRASHGHLEQGFTQALLSDQSFLRTTVETLLADNFPESLHDDLLAAVGLVLPAPSGVAERAAPTDQRRPRSSSFRQDVLRAYEHRCAVSGFRAALGGQYLGCEAAHVLWHSHDGPDTVENGFAVEPTLHKLFDAGAWTLSDDRRVLVSAELTGTDATIDRLRALHGLELRRPLAGEPLVRVEYIQWHREPRFGGVFRHPALPL